MTREQFIELVKGEQDALRHYLLALCCGDLATADDIALETLVKAYLSLLSYANKGKFRSWLFAIAHNTFLNHRKATRTYESLEEAKMVIDKQEAVTLYYLTGYSVKEIATISNSTEDAVKKQLSRGRDKLKSRLKR